MFLRCALGICLLLISGGQSFLHASTPLELETWDSALAQEELDLRNSKTNQLLKQLEMNTGTLQNFVAEKDKSAFQVIRIYDRPNDDPDQNQSVREKYKLPIDQEAAYSTAKLALILKFLPLDKLQYELRFQWLAEMMVGQNTEGARGCYLEYQNKKVPLDVHYPIGVNISSKTHEKAGSLITSPEVSLAKFTLDKDQVIKGVFQLKRATHTHYFIRYEIIIQNKGIRSVLLKSSNENPNFPEYDLYLIGSLSPFHEGSRDSIYFKRPEEAVFQPELVGDGDLYIASLFKKASCLKCHAGKEAKHGEEFSEEFGLPLYPEKIHSATAWLAEIDTDEERLSAIENMKNKWPRGMRQALAKLYADKNERKNLVRWLKENIHTQTK